MDINTIQTFAMNHLILWQLVVFFWILLTNIVPVMFFLYPDIFIFISIFLVKKWILMWYIPWWLLIVWAFIWEYISFYIWKKYWVHILEHKYFQKDISKKWIKKLEQNWVKTLIIWKVLPWIWWFIPVLSGITKMDTKKFLFWDFVMITYAVSAVFFSWLLWLHFAEQWFGKKVWFIIWWLLIVYIIWHLIYEFKIKKNKKL